MRRSPLIDDSRFIASIRGERYAVLLARGEVAKAFEATQRGLRRALESLDLGYPAPHLTLAGFAAGTELREVQAAVDRWARATAPLRAVTTGVELFDAPSFLVYLGVRKTASLERAYARLRREAKLRGLGLTREWQAIAPEDGKPHLSLAYRSRLRGDAWERVRSVVLSLNVEAASCLVPTIEVLAYEEDGEHRIASYPLGAGRRYN